MANVKNEWHGIGRLTKEVAVEETKGGTKVLHNSIAINNGKDKDGNERPATFIPVTFFGKSTEILSEYANKGDLIAVSGEITTGQYEKDGKTVYTWGINVDTFQLLNTKSNNDGSKPSNNANNNTSSSNSGFTPVEEDDLPTSDFMSMFKQ